jgi:hypothetical protein
MRVFRTLLTIPLLLAAGGAVAATPLGEAAAYLDGTWRGDNYVLRIDAARAQASVDAERPFEWTRFLVKEATDREIIFTVGAELFEARRGPDHTGMFLTSTSFRGQRLMWREDPSINPLDELRR